VDRRHHILGPGQLRRQAFHPGITGTCWRGLGVGMQGNNAEQTVAAESPSHPTSDLPRASTRRATSACAMLIERPSDQVRSGRPGGEPSANLRQILVLRAAAGTPTPPGISASSISLTMVAGRRVWQRRGSDRCVRSVNSPCPLVFNAAAERGKHGPASSLVERFISSLRRWPADTFATIMAPFQVVSK